MGEWVQIILQFAGVLFGGSIVGTFMFFKSKKRTESANASKAENEAESMRIDNKAKNYDVQNKIILDLKTEFRDLSTQFLDLSKGNMKLQLRLEELEQIAESNKKKIDKLTEERCTVENCDKRQPPRKQFVKECTNCKDE